jgi:hypothetical protein
MSIIKSGFIAGNSLGIVNNAKLNDDPAVHARFAAVTDTLRAEQKKRGATELSPYVDDFLYASCIMMHAAEASLIDQETGEPLKRSDGTHVQGYFEKVSGSGKDTVASIIQELTNNKFKVVKFADKLKDFVCEIINCTRENLEDEDDQQLVR